MHVRRRAVLQGWSSLAFGVLALAVALDRAFIAHLEFAYPYSAPVRWPDLVLILSSFRFVDLSSNIFLVILVALASATAASLSLRISSPPILRIAIALPQLLLAPGAVWGALSVIGDVTSLLHGRLDGEWLGEGWPLMEAIALWFPMPCVLFARAMRELLTAARPHAG